MVQGYHFGAHIFGVFYLCATSRRLWCTVKWLHNVNHCSESLSSGCSVSLCAGAVRTVWLCMHKYDCVCICTVTVHCISFVTHGICWRWPGGIWAYWTLLLYDAYVCVWVHSYVSIFKMVVFLHVTHSTFYTVHVVRFAMHVQYISVIMWLYRVLRAAGMHY